MALAPIPSNFYVTQANQQVFLQWDIAASATSYSVQKSTDNINFTTIASPAINNYLDTTVTVGTQYFYKIASINGSGTSPYTSSESIVPTTNGEMSLGELRTRAKQRCDREFSNFLSLEEWNSNINQSYMELYDLLVTTYEDYFLASPVTLTTDGTTFQYALPNGVNFNGAPAFYKLRGVDLALSTAGNAWITIHKFVFEDRNTYVYPNTASTIYGVFNMRYRVLGNNIEFIPTPSANQIVQLWYIPRINLLLKDSDITTTSISGWIEYVIIDAAIKAMQKEESDTSVLMAQKQAIIQRIQSSAQNRDANQPDSITDIRRNDYWNPWGYGGGIPGPIGGF